MRKLAKRWRQSIGCVKKFRLDSNVIVKDKRTQNKERYADLIFLILQKILLIVAQFPEVKEQDCPLRI